MAPSAGEPASDTADGLRSFILDQMEGEHQSPPSYNSWNGLAPVIRAELLQPKPPKTKSFPRRWNDDLSKMPCAHVLG